MKLRATATILCSSMLSTLASSALLTPDSAVKDMDQDATLVLPDVKTLSAETVVVARDKWGAPHIFAENDYALYFGYGYSLAQDRLYQLEMLKRSTQGQVAAVLGAEYLDFDKNRRQLFWPTDIKKQIDGASPLMKSILKGMAAGINHRVDAVRKNKATLLPREFTVNQFMPSKWDDYDVAMLFIGTMLLRYGDFNTELENQRLLNDLVAKHGAKQAMAIFNDALPRFSEKAPLTIPAQDWKKRWQTKTAAKSLPNGLEPSALPAQTPPQTMPRGHAFSNALVLGKKYLKSDAAILINGPQFGWYAPAYTYSAGFHSPTWNAVGNAPVGFPLPMFGYNANITWGSTWAAMDNVDIFQEQLHATDKNKYRHNGQWKSFRTRDEIIAVKGTAPVSLTVKASLHGPIIAVGPKGNYAYAKQRGWTGRELSTLEGWVEATRAKSHSEWHSAVSKSALNVNWYFADKSGNIGYASMGAYPIRHKDHDNRLPVSGTGEYDWQGIESPAYPPQVLNPSSGYVANWNNKPGSGVLNPDHWWASWSGADRIKVIDDAVKKAGKMSADQAWNVMMQAAFTDPSAAYFKPQMISALNTIKQPTATHKKMMSLLESWDDKFLNRDKNHYTNPANQIFRTWLAEMLTLTLADDMSGPIGQAFATTTGYGTPDQPTAAGLNISTGLKLLYEVTQQSTAYDFTNGQPLADLWQSSLQKTINRLSAENGDDPEKWLLPVPSTRFRYKNFLGIPQTTANRQRDDMPDMNRGTENNMTVFPDLKSTSRRDNGAVMGVEVVPPGQSGFISPDGKTGPHYSDQYDLYKNLGNKPTWLRLKDIQKNIRWIMTFKIPKSE